MPVQPGTQHLACTHRLPRSAPSGPPVRSSCTCCSRQGSCQRPMRQCHLATESALMPPGRSCSLSWSALESPAGEPFLFPQPHLREEAWSKAVWGCTVWASMAYCPLSSALTRWAQFLSVTPEFSGLDIPSGLSYSGKGQTPRELGTPRPTLLAEVLSAPHPSSQPSDKAARV